MTVWYSTFDDAFWLTLSGILVGVCGLSIRFCYRSKCKTIDCCGIHIERDIENEEKIDELSVQHHETKSSEDI
jgi:hypothetical protein